MLKNWNGIIALDDKQIDSPSCLDDPSRPDQAPRPSPIWQKAHLKKLTGCALHKEKEGEPLDAPEKWLALKNHTFHSWSASMKWRSMSCFKDSQQPVTKPRSLASEFCKGLHSKSQRMKVILTLGAVLLKLKLKLRMCLNLWILTVFQQMMKRSNCLTRSKSS